MNKKRRVFYRWVALPQMAVLVLLLAVFAGVVRPGEQPEVGADGLLKPVLLEMSGRKHYCQLPEGQEPAGHQAVHGVDEAVGYPVCLCHSIAAPHYASVSFRSDESDHESAKPATR